MTIVTSGTLSQRNATASSSDVSAALVLAELATDQKTTMAENLGTASLERMVRLKGKWKNCMPKLELLK